MPSTGEVMRVNSRSSCAFSDRRLGGGNLRLRGQVRLHRVVQFLLADRLFTGPGDDSALHPARSCPPGLRPGPAGPLGLGERSSGRGADRSRKVRIALPHMFTLGVVLLDQVAAHLGPDLRVDEAIDGGHPLLGHEATSCCLTVAISTATGPAAGGRGLAQPPRERRTGRRQSSSRSRGRPEEAGKPSA